MKGGKQPGAVRPPADNPAKHIVKARLTDEQKAKWDELGGSRWAKRMLDEATPLRFNPSFKTEAPKAPQADSLAPVDVYPDNPLYY